MWNLEVLFFFVRVVVLLRRQFLNLSSAAFCRVFGFSCLWAYRCECRFLKMSAGDDEFKAFSESEEGKVDTSFQRDGAWFCV